jgi:hypothetical protein
VSYIQIYYLLTCTEVPYIPGHLHSLTIFRDNVLNTGRGAHGECSLFDSPKFQYNYIRKQGQQYHFPNQNNFFKKTTLFNAKYFVYKTRSNSVWTSSLIAFSEVAMVFDTNELVYGAAIKNKNNSGKTIPMTMRSGERISMQLSSSISLPSSALWKPSLPPLVTDPKQADKLVLDTIVTDPTVLDALRALDARNIDYCVANSVALFAKELTADAVRAIYTPLIKSRDGVEFVRLRIPLVDGFAKTTAVIIVDREEAGVVAWRPGTTDDIDRGSKFIAVVDSYGMYLIGPNNIGMTLSLTNIMVWPGPKGASANGVGRFELDVTFVESSTSSMETCDE